MTHVVYVLESQRDQGLYIGMTRNLSVRLKRHNAGFVRSTKARRPFNVLGCRHFGSLEEAHQAELRLKSFKDPIRVRAWIG
ncbi:MAG: GIY-YIG nuclease family protein [Candidatus Omnitrophica bacterium]|nr:GIY-YIG nuclease family protein [Candidatus Omnitrophota bacterium]